MPERTRARRIKQTGDVATPGSLPNRTCDVPASDSSKYGGSLLARRQSLRSLGSAAPPQLRRRASSFIASAGARRGTCRGAADLLSDGIANVGAVEASACGLEHRHAGARFDRDRDSAPVILDPKERRQIGHCDRQATPLQLAKADTAVINLLAQDTQSRRTRACPARADGRGRARRVRLPWPRAAARVRTGDRPPALGAGPPSHSQRARGARRRHERDVALNLRDEHEGNGSRRLPGWVRFTVNPPPAVDARGKALGLPPSDVEAKPITSARRRRIIVQPSSEPAHFGSATQSHFGLRSQVLSVFSAEHAAEALTSPTPLPTSPPPAVFLLVPTTSGDRSDQGQPKQESNLHFRILRTRWGA